MSLTQSADARSPRASAVHFDSFPNPPILKSAHALWVALASCFPGHPTCGRQQGLRRRASILVRHHNVPTHVAAMNPNDTSSANVSTAPVAGGDIPGVARVQNLPPLTNRPGAKIPANTVMGDFVGGVLDLVARVLNPARIAAILSAAKTVGHYSVLAGGALTLLYAIFGAIKYNSFAVFAIGLGFVVALAVAQFVAIRFLAAADTVIASTPSKISSSAFLECTGLLVLLLAVATLLGGIAGAITAHSFMPLLPALFFGITFTTFGAVALHSQLVNVSSGDGTAGEEAIGLLSFFFKTGLKLVPLFFALLGAAGGLTILLSFFDSNSAFAAMAQNIVNLVPLPVQVPYGLSGSALVLIACLVPILSYFVFLLEYLVVDVMRAVLSVPAKLDALKR